MKNELDYFVEKSAQNKIVVKKSKNKDIKAKVYQGKNYYYLPEDLYEQYNEELQRMLREKKNREEQYNKETEEAVEKLFSQRRKSNNNVNYVHNNEILQTRKITTVNKREIKKPNPSKQKAMPKKYNGNKKTRLKAMVFAILIASSIGAGINVIDKNIEYEKVAKEVQELTNEEIQDEILDILKQEVSDATKKSKEDIKVWHSHPDFDMIRTEIIVGNDVYKSQQDLRSPFNIGNTLKSKGISTIIEETTSATSRKDLIKTLIKARKFSEEKDLEVDGDKLKEVKAEEDNER